MARKHRNHEAEAESTKELQTKPSLFAFIDIFMAAPDRWRHTRDMINLVRCRLRLCLFAVFVCAPALLPAQGPGGSSAEFLRLGSGARAAGLGDAYGATAEGAEALFWNVAGLASMKEAAQLTVSHAPIFEVLRHDTVGLAMRPLRTRTVLGLGLTRLSQPPLEGFDNQGNRTGDFRATDQSLALGLAAPLGSVSGGILLNAVESRVGERAGRTVLLDLGVRKAWSRGELGLAVRHLGQGVRLGARRESAPTAVQSSLRLAFLRELTLALQLDYEIAQERLVFGAGTELGLATAGAAKLSLRAGLHQGQDLRHPQSLLRGGFGLQLRRLSLDYALLPMPDTASSHRFTVGLKF